MAAKRVLVTGHRGYIGSVMAPYLMSRGYAVVGLDTGYFDACTIVPDSFEVPSIRIDLRDVTPHMLEGFDAVIHLAALSNDPLGRVDPEWTDEINHLASLRLAQSAKAAGVHRFLFASSCIMYGMADADVVDETAPLNPRTEYARSKVKAEEGIRALADEHFAPTFLRNGTVYGLSPRMRFDTVLNDLAGMAVAHRRVVVHSDGKPWRPVVHIEDIARSFHHVLEAPIEAVNNEAFNNGADHLNQQVCELARIVADAVPGCRIETLSAPGADQRTYRTDFGKFARAFPTFHFKWTCEAGALQLIRDLSELRLTERIFADARFTRLRWLTHLTESGRLDHSLRWTVTSRETTDDRRGEDRPTLPEGGRARQDHAHAEGNGPALHSVW